MYSKVIQNNNSTGQTYFQETDMVIAPLTMTSEREEVIDFVAPYFDQSGISIGRCLVHTFIIGKTESSVNMNIQYYKYFNMSV
jgi:hypothetical protein